jgi:cysteine desulfurase
MIYLDYNATTPLDPTVREAMLPFLDEIWGNPSSVHQAGRRARAALDDARDRAATVLHCRPSELTFTSGGTESVNLAIFGAARALKARGSHLITTQIEHHAVLHAFDYLEKYEGFQVTRLHVNREGFIDPSDLRQALTSSTVLVSVMAANNEIGVVQPIADLGALCQERGVVFHTDAVQWFGKEPCDSIHQFNANLVSLCGHKFHGPKGAGLLFTRSPLKLHPILVGGAHENELRAGTENLASIIGLVESVERFLKPPVFPGGRLRDLTNELCALNRGIPGLIRVGPVEHRLANTVSFLAPGCEGISLVAGLDLEGVCISSGSACSAGSLEPSHVIRALGYDNILSNSLIRFSLGRETALSDVQRASAALYKVVHRLTSQ